MESAKMEITIRIGRRLVSLESQDEVLFKDIWDAAEAGRMLADVLEMLAMPRPLQVFAQATEHLSEGPLARSPAGRVERAERALVDAAGEVVTAWEEYDAAEEGS